MGSNGTYMYRLHLHGMMERGRRSLLYEENQEGAALAQLRQLWYECWKREATFAAHCIS
jgi:hypothetical protein